MTLLRNSKSVKLGTNLGTNKVLHGLQNVKNLLHGLHNNVKNLAWFTQCEEFNTKWRVRKQIKKSWGGRKSK